MFAGLDEAATSQRDQRKSTEPRAARPLFAVPPNRHGERERRRQRDEMNAYLETVQGKSLNERQEPLDQGDGHLGNAA